jgi:hypothetical protein
MTFSKFGLFKFTQHDAYKVQSSCILMYYDQIFLLNWKRLTDFWFPIRNDETLLLLHFIEQMSKWANANTSNLKLKFRWWALDTATHRIYPQDFECLLFWSFEWKILLLNKCVSNKKFWMISAFSKSSLFREKKSSSGSLKKSYWVNKR